ncbi:MAG: glycoside hydrolase family 5 protein [Cyclobacteriaceae bacterium]|nr:glycoside hydrolase family 5 protein [Cyclobacteriaceae bacterium]
MLLVVFCSLCLLTSCDKSSDVSPTEEEEEEEEIVEQVKPLAQLPEIRKTRLSKGLNLAHWFAQQENGDLSKNYIQSRFQDNDFEFIKNSGFTYVRLSVDERILFIDPNLLKTEYLQVLDGYIQKFIDAEIAVLFDFHPTESFKENVHATAATASNVKIFWGKLAAHLSKFDADYLYLEVMNEPSAVLAKDWNDVQKLWVAEIRKNAPAHTIVVDGNLRITKDNWDGIAALTSIEPFADKNIVYNLHLYEPFAFTHQGATWGWEVAQYTTGLEYPMNEANCLEIKSKHSSKIEVGWAMDDYIKQAWNKDRLKAYIQPIADWSAKHNVYITVNEFGAYYYAENEGKLAYLRDMREIMEEKKLGWAVWEYDAGFSIVEKAGGTISFKSGMKSALGL